ncbi:zinc ribbon domain-containing protein [Natronobacterium texcoconense]|uniref:Zinc-ribbon domain-containing protein n=1 Tax=Natronobacterium texcoconense TaxID=1095778 RepID=A0A1H1EEQ4_NATTX|nr:zinc ribbon domain-containing protein [Natronobacterium texcoconense]SDQ86656.1 zinc-ribbon domain-containing protein [Natronobacterium texcoconense]
MASAQMERSAGETEKYCSSCGEIIKKKAELCPECGVRNENPTSSGESSTIGYQGYLIIGVLSATLALLFVPPVFGAVAIFCGYQVYKRHNELGGIGLMIYGGVALVFGMILGMITF